MRSSSCHLFASIFNSAAATFSSRCLTLEVPGIGSMTGDRASSHARATRDGVAFHRAAIRLIGLSEPETRSAASGNHGIKPIFSFSQYSPTSSEHEGDDTPGFSHRHRRLDGEITDVRSYVEEDTALGQGRR